MDKRLSKWDRRYIELAQQISTWSKDPSRKIGAVAVGSKGQILSQGYNGFPRGILDLQERYENREVKYKHVVHAEMNVIYNATFSGVSLDVCFSFCIRSPSVQRMRKGNYPGWHSACSHIY